MTSKIDGDSLTSLKIEIRCILVSSKGGLTLRQFLRDYEQANGKPFPYSGSGYKNPIEFFKTIPDIVTVSKTYTGQEVLLPVLSEKSAHISKFVLDQKSQRNFGRHRPVLLSSGSRRPILSTPPGMQSVPTEISPLMRGWEKNYKGIPLRQNFSPPVNSNSGPSNFFGFNNTFPVTSGVNSNNSYPLTFMTNIPYCESLYRNPSLSSYALPPDSWSNSFVPNEQLRINGNCKALESENTPSAKEISDFQGELDKKLTQCSNGLDKMQHSYISENATLENGSEENEIDTSIYGDEDDCSSLVSDNMKVNFRIILSEHPHGILSSKFPLAYQKKFGVPLNQNDLGYQSVKELVMACPDVFKIHKTKKRTDWLLFDCTSKIISPDDASKWIPRQVLENMEQLSRIFPKGISSDDISAAYEDFYKVPLDVKKLGFESLTSFLVNCQSIECKTVDEKCIVLPVNWGKKQEMPSEMDDSLSDPFLSLENVNFLWKKHFSELVCDPTFKFPKFILPNEKTLKVFVSDALSPDLIWLQNACTGQLLNELMFKLNNFYDEEEEGYKLNDNMLIPGLACCVKFNNRWHRALIYSFDEFEVKVMYVDYGTTAHVNITELRTLNRMFSDLPIQAIRAKLYDIIPIDKNGWSAQSVERLFELCLDQVFAAEIINVKPEIPSIEVVLCDTKGSEDVIINDIFITEHHALPRSKTQLQANSSQTSCTSFSVPAPSAPVTSTPVTSRAEVTLPSAPDSQTYPFMSYPECFLQLLPSWLNITGNWISANQVLEQAKCSFLKAASLYETSEDNKHSPTPSCCSHHLLAHIFVNKPKIFCKVWTETMKSVSSTVEKQFIKNLSVEMALPLNLKSGEQLCYLDNNVSNSISHDVHEDLEVETIYECKIDNNVENVHSEPHQKNSVSENNAGSNIMIEKSESDYESISCNPDKSISGRESLNNCGKKVMRSIIIARVGNNFMHLVNFQNQVYVIVNELWDLFAKSVPRNLVKHRLVLHRMNLVPIVITPNHKLLHAELVMHNLAEQNEKISMVPLKFAGKLIESIDPVQKHIPAFLEEMASHCTAEHSYWYE